jgi:hypothetical protein
MIYKRHFSNEIISLQLRENVPSRFYQRNQHHSYNKFQTGIVASSGVTFSYAITFMSIKSLISLTNPVVHLHPGPAHFIGYFCKHLVPKYPDL